MRKRTMKWANLTQLLFLVVGVGGWILVGCQNPSERLNAPPQGHSERPHPMQDNYIQMRDNAMLDDMSVSESHFVPHTQELNGTGIRLLKRYATLMKLYGGTLRYNSIDDPAALANGRVSEVTQFLLAEGVPANKMTVSVGLPGGRGMSSDEAVAVRKAGQFTPDSNGNSNNGTLLGIVGKPGNSGSK